MGSPDEYLYEYAVIRYVPRIDRGEFLNVGLLMMCKRRRWLHCELHLDEQRLRALDPNVDVENLRRQLRMFERQDVPFPGLPVEERYRWLTAAKSAILQTSPSHPGLAVAPAPFPTSASSPSSSSPSSSSSSSSPSSSSLSSSALSSSSPLTPEESITDPLEPLHATFSRLMTELVL